MPWEGLDMTAKLNWLGIVVATVVAFFIGFLWYGLIFMAMVLFKPEGIAGMWQAWKGRPRKVPAVTATRAGGVL